MAGDVAHEAVGTLRPESFAPPGYAGPAVATVKSSETKQVEAVVTAKPRRSLPLPDLPWRGLAIAAVLIAIGGAAYYAFLRPPTQATEVRGTIKNYLAAVLTGDGPHACALLTPHARYELLVLGTKAGVGGSCVAMMGTVGSQMQALIAQGPPGTAEKARVIVADAVDAAHVAIDPQHTRAVSRPFGRLIELTRVDGRWLVSDMFVTGKDPTPSHVTGAKRQFAIKADGICRAAERQSKPLEPALKTEFTAIRKGRTAPALASHLAKVQATNVAALAHMRQLHAPPSEAARYASYLESNAEQTATVDRVIALAQAENPEALDQMALAEIMAHESQKTAASLGFTTCS